MESTLAILGLGFLLGLQHAYDPDHVVAVSTLVTAHKTVKKASILGAIWGLGHTTTLFIAGIIILLLKISIPDTTILEFFVGAVICYLGMSVIRDVFRNTHSHAHSHGGELHSHSHSHSKEHSHSHFHKPYTVGIIHGLAGSAGLMLLVLSTVQSVWLGILFILIFGAGSIVGMAIIAGIIGVPFALSSDHDLWNKRIRYLTGIFSISFGIYLMWTIGFTEGLF